MEEREKAVYQTLEELGIEYVKYSHKPVYTIEEAEKELEGVDIDHCKNLFLRNHKGNKHYLVVMRGDKNADLSYLAQKIESTRLSFASERRLKKYLGLDKGAVSPFGLINDTENHVEVIVDKDIEAEEKVIFHPNVNDASIAIDPKDLAKFLEQSGNRYQYLEIS